MKKRPGLAHFFKKVGYMCIKLDGHFYIYYLYELLCLFEKTKINEKEAWVGQFFYKR